MAGKTTSGTVKLDVGEPPAPKKPAKAKAPETKLVSTAQAVVATGAIKKGEFLDRVAARTDIKRSDAKAVMEATLAELAETLMRGDEANLPPLGKLKVVKDKPLSEGAHALTLKLRTMKSSAEDGA